MKILTHINQIDKEKWQRLLEDSPQVSPFQTPAFFDFYNSLDDSYAEVFAVEKEGAYLALLVVTVQHEKGIKSFFSRRAIAYGGMLLLPEADGRPMSFLLAHLKSYYRHQVIYLEIRNNFSYAPMKEAALVVGFDYTPWLNFQFRNVTPEVFKKNMSKSRLRQLSKALNSGVTWREAVGVNEVQAFYAILTALYLHKVKKPLPPLAFFVKLYESSFAKLLLVISDDKVIGGVLCPFVASTTLYEFYICGLDKEYPNAHPSTVAMWAMVEYASQHNIKSLDLMGAGQPDCPSSVRQYKSKFGGDLVEHGRFILLNNRFLYRLGQLYLLLRHR